MSYAEFSSPVSDARLEKTDWFRFQETTESEDAALWVADHQNLIWSIARHFAQMDPYKRFDVNDIFQEISITAWLAYDSYDDHWVETKRSTYLTQCMVNRCYELFRSSGAIKRRAYRDWSLSVLAQNEHYKAAENAYMAEESFEETPEDMLGYLFEGHVTEDPFEDKTTERFWMEKIEELPEKPRLVMKLHLAGYKQVEIAKRLNRSQPSVSYYFSLAQKELSKYLKEVA